MIELRLYKEALPDGTQEGDIDEVVAEGVWLHLEVLSHDHVMLIIEDEAGERVHLNLTHRGRSPIRVTRQE